MLPQMVWHDVCDLVGSSELALSDKHLYHPLLGEPSTELKFIYSPFLLIIDMM